MIDECRSSLNIIHRLEWAHIKRAAKAQKTGGRNYVSGSRESL